MAYHGKHEALTEEHRKAKKIVAELEALLGAFAAPSPEPQLVRLDPANNKETKNAD